MFFCCCNRPNCLIDSDDFNRADTTDMSPKWREYDLGGYNGWQIIGNRLAEGTGYLEFTAEDPETTDGIRWSCKFNFGGATGAFALQVDRIDDSSYHFAEVICASETSATLRLWKQVSGSPAALTSSSPIAGFNWSTDHTLHVCWGVMGVVPECSAGIVGWVWTLNYVGDEPGWQPVYVEGECANGSFCHPDDPPPIVGDEVEGDTATTGCVPIVGGEGSPINALTAVVDGGIQLVAPSEPHGGVKVAVYRSGGGSNFRIDDAKLELLQSGCPNCQGAAGGCINCLNGRPRFVQIEITGGVTAGIYIMTHDELPFSIINGDCHMQPAKPFQFCMWFVGGSQLYEFGSRLGYFGASIWQDEVTLEYFLTVGIRLWNPASPDGSDFCDIRWRLLLSDDGLPDCFESLDDVDVPYLCHFNGTEALFSGAETCHIKMP